MDVLSIIIPAYNEEKYLPDTLEILQHALQAFRQERPTITEIVVVDNNSTDATAQIAREAGAKVVFEPHNQIARARNTGGRAASGSFLVFLDADTRISAELLVHTWDALSSEEIVGGGTQVKMDRKLGPVEALGLGFWNMISKTFKLAAGSYIFCQRDAFDTTGGFDERFYVSEEIHFSQALKRAGKKTRQRFVILDCPVVTSARKLDFHNNLTIIRMLISMLWMPWRKVRSQKDCWFWYDGKR